MYFDLYLFNSFLAISVEMNFPLHLLPVLIEKPNLLNKILIRQPFLLLFLIFVNKKKKSTHSWEFSSFGWPKKGLIRVHSWAKHASSANDWLILFGNNFQPESTVIISCAHQLRDFQSIESLKAMHYLSRLVISSPLHHHHHHSHLPLFQKRKRHKK